MPCSIEEWLEVVHVADAVRSQEMRKQGSGRKCVGECFVRAVERDVVAITEVGESMRAGPLRIESPGHAQGAQPTLERGGE